MDTKVFAVLDRGTGEKHQYATVAEAEEDLGVEFYELWDGSSETQDGRFEAHWLTATGAAR